MFTGLVEHLGVVVERRDEPPGCRLTLDAGPVAEGVEIGDSIAINGCCLTVVARRGEHLAFEAGAETLARTNLGELTPGDVVNLERSLKVGDRLGGHYVTGHIDGLGYVERRVDDPPWAEFWFRVPPDLTRQMAPKGSIAVDGVSLTLVQVLPDRFSVMLIPHTLAVTRLGKLVAGDAVNLETNVLAKYVAQQLQACLPDKPTAISPIDSPKPD